MFLPAMEWFMLLILCFELYTEHLLFVESPYIVLGQVLSVIYFSYYFLSP